jgi:hypothetical protein
MQQKEVMEISSEEEGKKMETSLSSQEISEVQKFVENRHPSKAMAVRVMDLFNDNAMSYFREILKRRQKQVSLDRFLVKVAQKEKE